MIPHRIPEAFLSRFLRIAAPAPRIGAAGRAILVSAGACARTVAPSDQAAFDQVIVATCDKSVVILGEASHGDGQGDAMKVALAEQLVSRGGFNGVLFEAGYYEFLPVARNARQGRPVSAAQVATAVDGPWKFDREVQPLFDFLAQQVDAGKLPLGGLDFQAGGFEQPFGNDAMFAELSAALAADRRDACRASYRSRLRGDGAPEGMSARRRDDGLKACLASIQSQAASPSAPSREKSEQVAELANLKTWLDAGHQPPTIFMRSRDAMMATNALRFFDALPKPGKVVIRANNVHAARNTAALPDCGDNDNLGQALDRRFGDSLFSLAFTARNGDYRWSWGNIKPIPVPPPNSLEGREDPGRPGESTFLGARSLRAAGETPPAVFGHDDLRALGRCIRRHAGAGFRISAPRQPALKAGRAAVRALLAKGAGATRRRPR